MRSTKHGDTLPADTIMDASTAELITDALVAEGEELQRVLYAMGVVSGAPHTAEWSISLDQFSLYCNAHCVVMVGHLPSCYWPKYKRSTQAPMHAPLCTCHVFCQCAECEHQHFVAGLVAPAGEPPDLGNCPDHRRVGRKRKADMALT